MTPRPLHYLAVLVCLAGWLALRFLDVPPPAPVEAAQPAQDASGGTREAWARDVLRGLGNAQPSAATVAFMVEWSFAEDSGDGAMARNNLLNTTICGHHFVGAINGDGACGVGHYATYQDGIDATIDTITQANFSAITAALQANDADGARAALFASPWASSHYDFGRSWPQIGE